MSYQVTVELRLREYYQAMPLEAISKGLANTDVYHANNVSIGKTMSPVYVIPHSRRQKV